MKKQFVGGEYFYPPWIYFKRKKIDLDDFISKLYPDKIFFTTMGGYYSILSILRSISLSENEIVLLPSYLCPSILYPFNKLKIKFQFYKVNEKLEIDLNDLKNKYSKRIKAIFYINYFGRSPRTEVLIYFKRLKDEGTIIIEDMVHNLFSSELIGNYAFNSFRKYLPIDASTIISDEEINVNKTKKYNSYFFKKIKGQYLRYLHYRFNLNLENLFLNYFKNAEEEYYQDFVYDINNYNSILISRYDLKKVMDERVLIYKELHSYLLNNALYKQDLNQGSSVGLPIVLNNRDKVRNSLRKKRIFCPVHWTLPKEIDKKEFEESWFLSSKILTIPTNQDMFQKDIKLILNSLTALI